MNASLPTALCKNYRLVIFAIGLLTTIVFFNVINGEFIYLDDPELVESNLAVHNFDIVEIFSKAQSRLYHPLTSVSWALDYKIAGLNPKWFHFTNLFLHLVNFFLVATLLTFLFPKHYFANIITATLFAIHPTRVESVAWIAERKDVLFAAFYLLASITYLRYLDNNRVKYYFITLLLFILSLLSKPMAVSFPATLFAFDYLRNRRLSFKTAIEKIPFFIFSILLAIIIIYIQFSSSVTNIGVTQPNQLVAVPQGLIFAISKSFVPYNLSFTYDGNTLRITFLDYFIVIAMAAIFIIVALKNISLKRKLLFAVLFFLITLSPTLRIISYGDGSIFNDRQLYLPAVGIFILIGLGIELLPTLLKRNYLGFKSIALTVLVATLFMAWLTYNRVNTFTKTETIWLDAISKYPNSVRAHSMLGIYYYKKKNFQLAQEELYKAYRLEPNAPLYIAWLAQSLTKLKRHDEAVDLLKSASQRMADDIVLLNAYAEILLNEGDTLTAKQLFEKVIALKSNHPKTVTVAVTSKAYSYLGLIASQQQDFKQTALYFTKAVELTPWDSQAYYNLGLAYYYLKEYDQSTTYLNKAITLDPNLIAARLQLVAISINQKKYADSETQLVQLSRIFPQNHLVSCYFGALYHATNELEKALVSFKQCLQTDPKISWAYIHLGNIYLAQDDRQKAYDSFLSASRLGYKVQPELLQDLANSIANKTSQP